MAGIVAIGLALALGGVEAWAQQTKKIPRIGVLIGGPAAARLYDEVFRQGLRELRYVEGQNVVLELRDAEAKAERLPDLAAELVRLKVDVILTSSTPAIQAVKQAAQTIPIVMAFSGDPVGTGLVASLAKPGGNITGLSDIGPESSGKHWNCQRSIPHIRGWLYS